MAATADKARFYLEQSIPELRELERKNIFSKDEISNIIKKRSDFEHKLNARGARSTDFARYVEFEVNLEALKKKRAKRLGIKASQKSSNRRVFQVLDRATKKFHGDLGLWMQYLTECRRQKSYNKINEVLSNVIRMHPTKKEVWIYAASYAMEEQGDIVEARSYMQRGLRFCRDNHDMWLTFARLELLYIFKIHARQEILGLNATQQEKVVGGDNFDANADLLTLPSFTAEDLNGDAGNDHAGKDLETLNMTPALSGAIPMAIFDAANKQFSDAGFGSQFFDIVLDFPTLPCLPKILNHVVGVLRATYPASSYTLDCYIRQPVVNISRASAEYPQALATAYARLKQAISDSPSAGLIHKTIAWLASSFDGDLQEDIKQALLAILLRVLKLGQALNLLETDDMVNLLKQTPRPNPNVLSICLDLWPENDELKTLGSSKEAKEATALINA